MANTSQRHDSYGLDRRSDRRWGTPPKHTFWYDSDRYTITKTNARPRNANEMSTMPVFNGSADDVIMELVKERMSFVASGSFIHVLGIEIMPGPHKRTRAVHMGTIHKSQLSEYLKKLEVTVEFPTDPWKLGLMQEKEENV